MTAGLIINSPAVIIGGMLLAPLFWPIIALSASIARGNFPLFHKSLLALVKASGLAVLLVVILALFSPFKDNPGSEILLRTEPNLFHLIIALFTGVAGAFVLVWPRITGVIIGVLIAAALMPALGVMGYGITTLDANITSGAFLLYLTNLIAIVFAGTVTLMVFGFRPARDKESQEFMKKDLIWAVILILLVSIPLSYTLYKAVEKNEKEKTVKQVLVDKIEDLEEGEVQKIEISQSKEQVQIRATIQAQFSPSNQEIQQLKTNLADQFDKKIDLVLTVIPTFEVR